jgi:hypothetical protein
MRPGSVHCNMQMCTHTSPICEQGIDTLLNPCTTCTTEDVARPPLARVYAHAHIRSWAVALSDPPNSWALAPTALYIHGAARPSLAPQAHDRVVTMRKAVCSSQFACFDPSFLPSDHVAPRMLRPFHSSAGTAALTSVPSGLWSPQHPHPRRPKARDRPARAPSDM